MKFDFSDDGRNELTGFFSEALNTVRTETDKLFETMVEKYTTYHYKPLYTTTVEIADYFEDGLRTDCQRRFSDWQDSDSSLRAFAMDLEAGDDESDDSLMAAQQIESDLEEAVEELFSVRPETPDADLTASVTVELSTIFEEVTEAVKNYSDALDELMNDCDSEAQDKSDDNALFENVNVPLQAILTAFKSVSDAFSEGVENLSEHLEEKGSSAKEKSENDKTQMSSDAESAGDELRDVSSLFTFN